MAKFVIETSKPAFLCHGSFHAYEPKRIRIDQKGCKVRTTEKHFELVQSDGQVCMKWSRKKWSKV